MCNISHTTQILKEGIELESTETVDKLFFELASETRLSILRELQTKNLKMQELARHLDITATDAFRQLERLSSALLVQRQPDGAYALTQYGKLELHIASSIEFVLKNKQYFLTHDIWQLPPKFINRIGELSQATLRMGLVESTFRSSQMIGEAKKLMWAISPEPLMITFDELSKQIPAGAEYRILSPQSPAKFHNLENRTLAFCPAICALTENGAALCFRFVDGRLDYAGFLGNDDVFRQWVKDLFLYYWEWGKRF
jgi:predicted transcriptional regulator